eukprot:607887_1
MPLISKKPVFIDNTNSISLLQRFLDLWAKNEWTNRRHYKCKHQEHGDFYIKVHTCFYKVYTNQKQLMKQEKPTQEESKMKNQPQDSGNRNQENGAEKRRH